MAKGSTGGIAGAGRINGSAIAIFVALLAGCASAPPVNLAAQQAILDAKTEASTEIYAGDADDVRHAAHDVLAHIDRRFQIALTDTGLSAARGWSSYMGLSNVVGTDFWVVRIKPTQEGTEVFVNAVTRSGNRGPLDMAIPDASGLMADIPLTSAGGLTPEEMDLFHRRLEARLAGQEPGPSCDEAFKGAKRDYPLTCNRGGVTTYF